MFDLERFTADCRAALAADSSHRLVREVVMHAVSDPSAVLKGIGEPKRAEVQKLYHAPDLTILNVIWGPMMTIMPHNHQMWAVIGIYTGREDNVFWRRLPDGSGKVEAAGARALCVGDAEPLPLGSGNGALRLTTARYFTPSGRSIQAKGISPDIEVLQDVPEELKARTDTRGEASLRGHLKAEGDEQTGSQSYIPPDPKDDKALHSALDLIRGIQKNSAYPPHPKTAVPN